MGRIHYWGPSVGPALQLGNIKKGGRPPIAKIYSVTEVEPEGIVHVCLTVRISFS